MKRCATASSNSARNLSSAMPIADARQSGFTPIFCRRDGGFLILSAHFVAAAPRSKLAVSPPDVTESTPLQEPTFSMSLNGIESFKASPRNCRTLVSSRAFPELDCPLNVAVQVASAPIFYSAWAPPPRQTRSRGCARVYPEQNVTAAHHHALT